MITELPLRYFIRHVPKGKKKATLGIMRESYWLDIPEVEQEKAPVVGVLHAVAQRDNNYWVKVPQVDFRVEYRATRTADGTVRLLANALEGAFQNCIYTGEGRAELDNLPVFGCLAQPSTCTPDSPDIGQVLSTDRDVALERLHALINKMVVIDGNLWMPCAAPGWQFNENRTTGWSLIAVSNPFDRAPYLGYTNKIEMEKGIYWHHNRAPFVPNEQGALDSFQAKLTDYQRGKLLLSGEIESNVEGALKDDPLKHTFRYLLKTLAWPSADVVGAMTEQEMKAMFKLREFDSEWLEINYREKMRVLLKMAQVVHGIKVAGNKDTLDEAIALNLAIQSSLSPLSLEQKLKRAGVEFELPDNLPTPG